MADSLRDALEKLVEAMEAHRIPTITTKTLRDMLDTHHGRAVVSALDRAAVDDALRQVIAHADYDLHKQIECDEETGEDTYAEHVDRFVEAYAEARH